MKQKNTQIIPVNYNLMSVNLMVGVTGFYQAQKKIRADYFGNGSVSEKPAAVAAPPEKSS